MSKPVKIHLDLTTDKDVTNDTVKLLATVNASVQPAERDVEVRKNVHAALRDVVQGDWNIGQIIRNSDASGLESVMITASLRVPETENYSLDRRARSASRPGLQITRLVGDASLPLYMIRDAQRVMRDALLLEAGTEADRLSKACGLHLRVSRIDFTPPKQSNHGNLKAMNAYATTSALGGADAGESFGRTEKLFLTAKVTITEAKP